MNLKARNCAAGRLCGLYKPVCRGVVKDLKRRCNEPAICYAALQDVATQHWFRGRFLMEVFMLFFAVLCLASVLFAAGSSLTEG